MRHCVTNAIGSITGSSMREVAPLMQHKCDIDAMFLVRYPRLTGGPRTSPPELDRREST